MLWHLKPKPYNFPSLPPLGQGGAQHRAAEVPPGSVWQKGHCEGGVHIVVLSQGQRHGPRAACFIMGHGHGAGRSPLFEEP